MPKVTIGIAQRMRRRSLLKALATTAALGWMHQPGSASANRSVGMSRTRPSDADWPSPSEWEAFGRELDGRLLKVSSPISECVGSPDSQRCSRLFASLRNPYLLGEEAGLTQTLGWVDAWTSHPSVYAVAAESAADVAAAIDFARRKRLRLVVKGGGHSYQGTSNAPDSLLVWTSRLNGVDIHEAFVPAGCEDGQQPVPAVSIGAGALWGRVYDEVASKAGRYVAGGGCLTVGVAGLIQSGGFSPFSKAYGTAAASLVEAEIVTADGIVRTVNACRDPELFWAIKGGGGGTFGVVTRVTVRTHAFPDWFGGVFATVRAKTPEAFHALVAHMLTFYSDALCNPHWGEQISVRRGEELRIGMVFQGLSRDEVAETWRPFLAWIAERPAQFSLDGEPSIVALPAQDFWSPELLRQVPDLVLADARPGAPQGNIFWSGNAEEAAQVLHAYQSTWMHSSLLRVENRESLADALVEASRHWSVTLHFNKGLAGAPAEAIAAARDTATNPIVLESFALAISAAEGPPAYPGVSGFEPDVGNARRQAAAVRKATDCIRDVVPGVGSYVSESDFFEENWQQAFWGRNYGRLLEVKKKYDPEGLFFVHHGVGSEDWSLDGFTPVADATR